MINLIAYITESVDRDLDTVYIASICDKDKNEILTEFEDYDRDALEAEIKLRYPGVDIENG